MRPFRMLSSVFLAIILLFPTSLVGGGRWDVVRQQERSVIRLMGEDPSDSEAAEPHHYTCSSFSIHKQDSVLLTAVHCLTHVPMFAYAPTGAKYPLVLLWADVALDVAVVEATGLHVLALRPRVDDIERGLEVGALGFAYGLETLYFASGTVAYVGGLPAWEKDMPGLWTGAWLLVSAPFIGGQSGGPIFDREGKVVGIVQRTGDHTGFGRPINSIYSATQAYWQYQR